MEREARQALEQRLIPKLSYQLHLTSFNKAQCQKPDSVIRPTFLSRMRLNRNLPIAVAHAPLKFGGMALPESFALQTQVQVPYLLRQLRWDKTVANDTLVTLDTLQLQTGFVSPIMKYTDGSADYVGHSFFLELRQRLSEIDTSLWIEKAWAPKLQRDGDEALMERFCDIPGITTGQLVKVNDVCIYVRMVTISDLTNPQGTHICDGMLGGSFQFQAGSDLYWPETPCPPEDAWAVFRKCLRQTFCTNVPIYQPKRFSMKLDKRLGGMASRHTARLVHLL